MVRESLGDILPIVLAGAVMFIVGVGAGAAANSKEDTHTVRVTPTSFEMQPGMRVQCSAWLLDGGEP